MSGRSGSDGAGSGSELGDPVVTIDIGHDATELAARIDDGTIHTMSLPIGATTVTEAYLHSDPPRADELSAALSVIELHLDDLVRERPEVVSTLGSGPGDQIGRGDHAVPPIKVIGLGAVRFIAEVELGRNEGDTIDGYVLERAAVEEVFRALATESNRDRSANPGLHPEHVGWIVGALCILVEFMRQFVVEAVLVSTASAADALIGPAH